MRDNNQHHADEAIEAPPELVAALKRLPQERVFVPPTVDEAVLRAARTHLEGMSGVRFGWFWRIRERGHSSPPVVYRSPGGQECPRSWWRALLRPRTGALRFAPWAAAAAVIVLLVAIPAFFKHPAPEPARGVAFVRWDLNQDGRVDILDAFSLARQLKQGGTRNLQLDVNGDGVVDERDVAAMAARAVRLEQGGRS